MINEEERLETPEFSPDASPAPAEEGGPEAGAPEPEARPEEAGGEELPELDPETLNTLVEAFADELSKHPRLQERLVPTLEERIRQQYQQQTLAEQTQQIREWAIQQGREAAESLTGLISSYREAVKKLSEGEDIDEKELPPVDQAGQLLAAFGTAIYSDVTATYDTAFTQAFLEAAQGIPITNEDTQKIAQVVEIARRMEGDPAQADRAKAYLFAGVMRTLVDRVRAVAREEAMKELSSKRQAIQKITEANALKVALARKAAQKLPPASPTPGMTASAGGTMEDLLAAYEAARDRGDTAEADRLAFEMARLRRGL